MENKIKYLLIGNKIKSNLEIKSNFFINDVCINFQLKCMFNCLKHIYFAIFEQFLLGMACFLALLEKAKFRCTDLCPNFGKQRHQKLKAQSKYNQA